MKSKIIKRVLMVSILVYVMFIFIKQQTIINRQDEDMSKYSLELEKYRKENEKLQDEMKLAEDNKYVEKLAREKLGLVKEGETPVIENKENK